VLRLPGLDAFQAPQVARTLAVILERRVDSRPRFVLPSFVDEDLGPGDDMLQPRVRPHQLLEDLEGLGRLAVACNASARSRQTR
jgi:hypothetical protein